MGSEVKRNAWDKRVLISPKILKNHLSKNLYRRRLFLQRCTEPKSSRGRRRDDRDRDQSVSEVQTRVMTGFRRAKWVGVSHEFFRAVNRSLAAPPSQDLYFCPPAQTTTPGSGVQKPVDGQSRIQARQLRSILQSATGPGDGTRCGQCRRCACNVLEHHSVHV